MPFSAISPEGRVTLIGVDPLSMEAMRARNRKERCFTAKCCGAPLSIRVAAGKAPHFVHQVTPDGCDGDKRETPEHRRLKQVIAEAAMRIWGWDVETEARETDETSGRAKWQADVLAIEGRTLVAFEVQLSNADYALMLERQTRYRESKVRGLWFVRTKKGFPPTKELPVFTVESGESGDWVQLSTRWDLPNIWSRTDQADWVELSEFVEAALDGRLKWAPYLDKPDTWLHAEVRYQHRGTCPGCARTVVAPLESSLFTEEMDDYPRYYWHEAMSPRWRTSWHHRVVSAVWAATKDDASVAFTTRKNTCSWCGAPAGYIDNAVWGEGTLAARLKLGGLPKPAYGTVEWDWLRRWHVVRE